MNNTAIAEPLPLSLYVHFPWCVRKCPYCDFNSHQVRGEVPERDYIAALCRDLDFELTESRIPNPESRTLISVFLGGGTPSLFSAQAIGRVLEAAAKRLPFAPDIEITLEANPGTVDEAHFSGYRAAGVNRLSIGVQSLNAEQLKALGRIHDPEGARRALRLARKAGFDNVNLDLMFALPRQTLPQAQDDLRELCALAPEHVSYYHLTLEPNTEFHARPPPLPDSDTAYAMLEAGQEFLATRGYAQYEVSAYAAPGLQSRHNRNYWEFGDYIGIGAGAHGKRTFARKSPHPSPYPLPQGEGDKKSGLEIHRRARQKHPRTYMETAGTTASLQEDRAVPAADLPFEYAMNALRLNEGFTLSDFELRTGLDRTVLDSPLRQAQARGLVEVTGERVQPTAAGRAHLNALLQLFLP